MPTRAFGVFALNASELRGRVQAALRGREPDWLIPAVARAAGTTPSQFWRAMSPEERLRYFERMVRDEVPYYLHIPSRELIIRLGMPAHTVHRARQEVARRHGLNLSDPDALRDYVPPPKGSRVDADFGHLFRASQKDILPVEDLEDMVGSVVDALVDYAPVGAYLIVGHAEDLGEQRLVLCHLDTGERIRVPLGGAQPIGKIMMGDYARTVAELDRLGCIQTAFRWVPVDVGAFKMATARCSDHIFRPGGRILIR